ncbi:CoA transferase [Microbacteriaceae bacterium K1510]|nr:CoA transferase [Microbacteriaceae bacterium K1510]
MQPLKGVQVLDCTKVLAGPLCTQYLSDLGAEIIKIEPTVIGDETRRWPPIRGDFGSVFLSVNRNKKSLALDLKSPEGRRVIAKLIRKSDVLIESYATGVSERLGIDYASAAAERPDIIHCSISGFGRTGPLSHGLGYDVVLQAFSGIMSMTGEPGGGPIRSPISPIDQATGLHAMGGILAGLIERGKTGKGCSLEVSLFETAVAYLGYNLQTYWEKGVEPTKCGSGHESLCPYQAFYASDAPLLIGIANDNLWGRFCRAIGREELIVDPRFRSNPDRVANFKETVALVQSIVATRPRDEWVSLMNKIGVPCAPINSLSEMLAHPHTKARGIILDYEHPDLGALKTVSYPVVFDGEPRTIKSPPPRHGEHTREILEGLGYEGDQIEKLRDAGVVSIAG